MHGAAPRCGVAKAAPACLRRAAARPRDERGGAAACACALRLRATAHGRTAHCAASIRSAENFVWLDCTSYGEARGGDACAVAVADVYAAASHASALPSRYAAVVQASRTRRGDAAPLALSGAAVNASRQRGETPAAPPPTPTARSRPHGALAAPLGARRASRACASPPACFGRRADVCRFRARRRCARLTRACAAPSVVAVREVRHLAPRGGLHSRLPRHHGRLHRRVLCAACRARRRRHGGARAAAQAAGPSQQA